MNKLLVRIFLTCVFAAEAYLSLVVSIYTNTGFWGYTIVGFFFVAVTLGVFLYNRRMRQVIFE